MNEIITKDNIKIEDLIYEIRGKQVMLDSDLAMLYGCKNGTKSINLAVKRHINRFPERFMFRLTEEESKTLWFQSETKKNIVETRGGKYNRPYVFTEQGVAMLSSILRTSVAEEISIKIMDAFVEMKKYLATNNYSNRLSNIETKIIDHDNKFDIIFKKLDNNKINNHIFFEGQIYDAYSLMIDILSKAKEEIIIIDNYAGKKLFDLLRNIEVPIKVYSQNLNKELIEKYNSQYHNITAFTNNAFHDRFIIIDKKLLYHCGSSFKDLGIKCFAINLIEDKTILANILKHLNVLQY